MLIIGQWSESLNIKPNNIRDDPTVSATVNVWSLKNKVFFFDKRGVVPQYQKNNPIKIIKYESK